MMVYCSEDCMMVYCSEDCIDTILLLFHLQYKVVKTVGS